jgi:hypothetical protein
MSGIYGEQAIDRFQMYLSIERLRSPELSTSQLSNEVIKNLCTNEHFYSNAVAAIEDAQIDRYAKWKQERKDNGMCKTCSHCIQTLDYSSSGKRGYCRLQGGAQVDLNDGCEMHKR